MSRPLDALGSPVVPDVQIRVARCSDPHRGHRLVDRGRVAGQAPGPQGLQADQAGHPLPVGLPVAGDHPDNAGQVTALGAQLGDLGLVLGEDDPGAAVGDDEGDVFAPGRGVDGGRRGAAP